VSFQEGLYIAWTTVSLKDVLEGFAVIADEKLPSTHPYASQMVLQDGVHTEVGNAKFPIGAFKAVSLHPKETAVGGYQDDLVGTLIESADKVASRDSVRNVVPELAGAELDQAASVGSDPQAPIPRGQQSQDAIVSKSRHVLACVGAEPRAIESHQAAAGADPKVAVGGFTE
jgi:hypothetical protein